MAQKPSTTSLGWLWANGSLTLVMFSIFVVCWLGLLVFGRLSRNKELRDHHAAQLSIGQYLKSGHLWEATTENWEGEFLPMALFTLLTAKLVQKGSPESKEPDEQLGPVNHQPNSPWPTHRGPLIRWLYGYSLTLSLFMAFGLCMFFHAWTGACLASDDARLHGQSPVSIGQFVTGSEFWFQSFQNYQSEFLANGSMVLLAIFLRQKGSPESKRVNTPTWEND